MRASRLRRSWSGSRVGSGGIWEKRFLSIGLSDGSVKVAGKGGRARFALHSASSALYSAGFDHAITASDGPILAITAEKPPILEAYMFISPAYAQASGGGGDFLISLFPIILMFGIVYFLIIRPQSQRVKKHREMVEALRRGDTVVTSGGIMGKVTKVSDNEATVEIAEGVRVRVVKSTISDVTSKTEPAGTPSAANKNESTS